MRAGDAVDELCRYPEPVGRFPYTALEYIADAELPSRTPHIHGAAFVDEGGIAGDDRERFEPAEGGDDVLNDAVGEIVLLGIAAHVLERQDSERRFVGQRQLRRWRFNRGCLGFRFAGLHLVGAHWPRDVLEGLLPEIDKLFFDFVAHLPIGVLRYANPANLANAFEPRGDVDAVAHQIAVALLDHIAQMNADTKFDAALRRKTSISLHHAALHFECAAHSVNNAAKFDDGTITRALDHAPMMHGDDWIDQVAAEGPKSRQGAILVRSDEAAVAHHVRDQDCRDFPPFAHRHGIAQKPRQDRPI